MLHRLDEVALELYHSAYEGERWTFMPRADGNQFGLAIAVVGRSGKYDVPLDLCRSDDFDTIKRYARELNELPSEPDSDFDALPAPA